MNSIRDLHRKAMDLTDQAESAKRSGEIGRAQSLFRMAFELERDAAMMLIDDSPQIEPTRSILLRSAASLALDCEEYREAERLISIALTGEPPEHIAEELRDLMEQVHFERHLKLRGISLESDEVQMVISGRAVGFGYAVGELFVDRLRSVQHIFYRTAERILKRPYRTGGQMEDALRNLMQSCISIPRAGSFAVSLRIGRPVDQQQLSLGQLSVGVIDEVMECFELFNRLDIDQLKARMQEEAYFNNFIGLANSIAPDGEEISMVGFTALREGKERSVALTRRHELAIQPVDDLMQASHAPSGLEVVEVKGELLLADSKKARKHKDTNTALIELIDADNIAYKVIVPVGMMSDIVKPLWGDMVVVKGTLVSKRTIQLLDIHPLR